MTDKSTGTKQPTSSMDGFTVAIDLLNSLHGGEHVEDWAIPEVITTLEAMRDREAATPSATRASQDITHARNVLEHELDSRRNGTEPPMTQAIIDGIAALDRAADGLKAETFDLADVPTKELVDELYRRASIFLQFMGDRAAQITPSDKEQSHD